METLDCWKLKQRLQHLDPPLCKQKQSVVLTSYFKELKFVKSQISLLKEIAMNMQCWM